MPTTPIPAFATIATIQQAITVLLTTREPEFQRFGLSLFLALVTGVILWQGIKMMLAHSRGLDDQTSGFVQLLLKACAVYALIVFYETPIPGVGVSFTNVITDSCAYFMNVMDARSLENTFGHLDTLWSRFLVPDTWSILANLIYWLLLIVITLTKAFSLAVVAFGLIASAVCALLGPIFVPFLILPGLDWLFWGWLKSFVQYSFIPVVAFAYLMVFEQFIYAFVTTIPPGISDAQYPLYALQVLVVVGTFAFGIVLVPYLTTSLFAGYAHGSTGGFMAVLTKKEGGR